MSTFQQQIDKAIGPCDKVTLTRIEGVESDMLQVQFETIDEMLGPLLHREYIDVTKVTPRLLMKAIEEPKAHIQSAVEVLARTRENADAE